MSNGTPTYSLSSAGVAPRLTAPMQDLTVESDRPVEIVCQFEASPPPSVQWLREGLNIQPSNDFAVSEYDGTYHI